MPRSRVEPVLVGLDLNASRARAVGGQASAPARPLPLGGTEEDLPLAISLEGRRAEVGRAGTSICRQMPHLVCLDYVAALGTPREWVAGRHRLDAGRCVSLFFERIQAACTGATHFAFALPAYLTAGQVAQLLQLAAKSKLSVVGTISTPLAVALAAHSQQPFEGLAVVADVDDHALCLAAVSVEEDQARLLAETALPRLRLPAWKSGVIDAVAERCVRHSRRDPRDSAAAEQSLFDQLDDALASCRHGRAAELGIRAAQWFQNLFVQPEEITAFCARLTRQAFDGVRGLLAESALQAPRAVLMTDAAARLPGLEAVLQELVGEPGLPADASDPDDFGEDLLPSGACGPGRLTILAADGVARSAHDLADRFHRGELPREHLGHAVSLAAAPALDVGAARLQFRDQDYPLEGLSFTLGRQPGCDLVFDSAYYPTVSARHCEIVSDRRGYVVRDRSRNGTLLNGRPVPQQAPLHPGDWIRLGPDGPQLRFLGHAGGARQLGTTA